MKLFKLYEQVEQEQKKEPKMVTLTPVDKKFLKLMQRKEIDNGDGGEIWEFLTDTLSIDDQELALRLAYLYMEDLIDEDEGETYDDLERVNIDIEGINKKFDDKILALSAELGEPPFLIEDGGWGHYGLDTYEVDGDTYAVGDEDEMDNAMEEYAQNLIDEGLGQFESWWIEQYLESNDDSIEQFAEEEADNRIEGMSDEEILEETGEEGPDDFREYLEIKISEKEDYESQKEDLEGELYDLEIDEDEERMVEIEDEIAEIESEINDLDEEISDLEDKIENFDIDEAKEELRATYVDNTLDEIRSDGVSYFTGNLGMDFEDAVDYYFWFDEESAKYDLANEQGYEPVCSYDGGYNEQEVDDITYFILRVD